MGRRRKVENVEAIEQADAIIEKNDVEPAEIESAEERHTDGSNINYKTQYAVSLLDKKSFLNLRSGAGKEHPSISHLNDGEIVDGLGYKETIVDGSEWVLVSYKGTKGFVLSSKLKEI